MEQIEILTISSKDYLKDRCIMIAFFEFNILELTALIQNPKKYEKSYESDMNLIMPVLMKIEKSGWNTAILFDADEQEYSVSIHDSRYKYEGLGETLSSAVCDAVIQFLLNEDNWSRRDLDAYKGWVKDNPAPELPEFTGFNVFK